MGLCAASSAAARGPTPRPVTVLRRNVEFEKFVFNFSIDGKTTNVPIKYTPDPLSLLRSSGRLTRGDKSEWTDAVDRPRLVRRLRKKLRRLRVGRKSEQSSQILEDLWERALDAQAWVYRQAILEQVSDGIDMVEVPESWRQSVLAKALKEAKDLFHAVYDTNGRMPMVEGRAPALPAQPTYELVIGSSGKKIRNSLQSSPSRSKSDDSDVKQSKSQDGPRSSAPSLQCTKPMTLLSDTGASNHSCNTRDLTEEQKRQIRPLEQPVVLDTANGPIVVDSYIEISLLKLGAARPLRFLVCEDSPNLLSVGKLVLEEGFRFFWEGKRAHLVSPQGHHTWLDTCHNVPELRTRELVVNKINEIEGQALVAAKSQRRAAEGPEDNADSDTPFNQSGIPKEYFYLELFMGTGRMSKALRQRLESAGKPNVKVIGFDMLQGRDGDLLHNDVYQRVMAMINSGRCLGVWMAPPCASWSTSRRNDEHKGAPPLRSKEHMMGLPTLNAKQRRGVAKMNALMIRCYDFAANCILNKVPFAIENPLKSLIWQTQQFLHLANLPGVECTRMDFCMYGEPYHKATRILSWRLGSIGAKAKTCKGRGGLCCRTGLKHELLTGVVECPKESEYLLAPHVRGQPIKEDEKMMIWKAKLAEPYPE